MSLSNAVIDAMLAAGCSAEQLAAAMKAANADAEARRVAKRAGNAERQRRFKAKNRTVTQDNAGNALPSVTPPNKEIPPTPPKEINPPISPITSDEVIPPSLDRVSVEEVVEGWNELAVKHGLARIAKLSEQRRRKVQAQSRRFAVPDWINVFSKIAQSPFLRGENDRDWRCDFDFILSEQNFIKILEGKYDRKSA